jgi:hypothetical protein
MKAQVSREPAIFEQVVGYTLFQRLYFFGAPEQGRVDLTDAEENKIAELLVE